MSHQLTRLSEEQAGLRADMLERIEHVEKRLVVIREDIAADMGRAEQVHLAADHTRAELRSLTALVQEMERNHRTLRARG